MKTNAQDTTKGRTLKNQEWVAADSNFTLLLMVASLVEAFPVAAAVVTNFIFDWKSLNP
jgi:hypothetical protein